MKREDEPTPETLNAYFRELATLSLMGPEEELALARKLAALRESIWRAALEHTTFTEGILEMLVTKLGGDAPAPEMEVMRKASAALRRRDSLAYAQAFTAARETLARRLAEVDVDREALKIVLEDLVVMRTKAAEPRLRLNVPLPRRTSRLFAQYADHVLGLAAEFDRAKDAFVKANLRLVITIARRYNHGRLPLKDIIQEGNIGLMKAVDRFDHRRGFRFSTYGGWWIRHAITRAIACKGRLIRLPVHVGELQNRVARARRDFEAMNGRRPTAQELADVLGASEQKITAVQRLETPVSIDAPLDDGLTFGDTLEEPSPLASEQIDTDRITELLPGVLRSTLSPIEHTIICERFGFEGRSGDLTLKELGDQFGLSRERIRQLQQQALEKLQCALKRLGIESPALLG